MSQEPPPQGSSRRATVNYIGRYYNGTLGAAKCAAACRTSKFITLNFEARVEAMRLRNLITLCGAYHARRDIV